MLVAQELADFESFSVALSTKATHIHTATGRLTVKRFWLLTQRTKIKELITVVSPRTFARWASGETKSVGKKKAESKGGRPRKPEEVRQLVVQMAKDSGWGLGRIMGELKKLGLTIGKGTVRNILLENGFNSGPNVTRQHAPVVSSRRKDRASRRGWMRSERRHTAYDRASRFETSDELRRARNGC